eukprot:m.1812 g.1812  ORF g.1812 m.1812 type:complete len:56 (-) comp1279_c0_seq1:10-177(-)
MDAYITNCVRCVLACNSFAQPQALACKLQLQLTLAHVTALCSLKSTHHGFKQDHG